MGAWRAALGPISVVIGALAVVVLAVAGLLYMLFPQIESSARVLAVVGVVLLLIFIVGGFDLVRGALRARQARYGTNTVVMIAAFIAIAGLTNFVGARFHHRFDTTASGEFTLSRHTQSVLRNLKDEVKVIGFFVATDRAAIAGREQARKLLREYAINTDKISFEFVDPEDKPHIARQYEIRDYGALVFTSGGRKQQTFGIGEQDFTGAILNVTGVEQKRVYFLTGHGEPGIDSADEGAMKLAKEGLQTDNYRVETLDLINTPKIPDDATVLVIAAPKKPLESREIAAIETYLTQGGKAVFLLEPDPPQELKGLLAKWGLSFKPGLVVDTFAFAQPNVYTPAVLRDQYLVTQVTKDLDTTVFPGATAIFADLPEDDRQSIQITPLARTSFQSWQTTNAPTEGVPAFAADRDTRGPLVLAAQVEAVAPIGGTPRVPAGPSGTKTMRLIVVGDSDFATNKYFYSKFNSDLFLNSVNWLGAQEELISIRPKPPQYRRLIITQGAWNWILYSSVGFLPGLVLVAGGVVWWRRR